MLLQVLVKEALQLSARLRLPNSIPTQEVRGLLSFACNTRLWLWFPG